MAVDIKKVLRRYVQKTYGTQAKAAEAWGCAQSNVSQALSGKQEPSAVMLKAIGYELDHVQHHYKKV